MNKPLSGQGYDLNSTNKGFSLNIHGPEYVEPGDNLGVMVGVKFPDLPQLPNISLPDKDYIEFQCRVTRFGNEQLLKIRKGSVTYSQSNMPLIKNYASTTNKQCRIEKVAVYEGVTEFWSEYPDSPDMLDGGGYVLSGSGKWIVALCKWDIVADGFNGTDLSMPALLAEERPFLAIYKEGTLLAEKINAESGPSLYQNEFNVQKMDGYKADETGDTHGDWGYGHTTYFNPRKIGFNHRIIAVIDSGSPDIQTPTVTRIQAANPTTQTNEIHRVDIKQLPKAGNFKLNYTESITGTSDPFDPLFGGEFELGVSLKAIAALKGNVAVKQHSETQYDIEYANNLNNVPITLPTIVDNTMSYFNYVYLVTQHSEGSQDIVIPLCYNGAMLKNVLGQSEQFDPYYDNHDNNWNKIINIYDIELLEGLGNNFDWYTDVSVAPASTGDVRYEIPGTILDETMQPFQIYLTTIDGEQYIKVHHGTINNIETSNTFSAAEGYIYLVAESSGDTYPSNAYIIQSEDDALEDTDSIGYIKLGYVHSDYVVDQYVSGSVWSERHKYTEPDTATYYFYRV